MHFDKNSSINLVQFASASCRVSREPSGVNAFNITDKTYPAGKNSITLNRNNLASGNYLLVLKGTDNQRNTKLITIQ